MVHRWRHSVARSHRVRSVVAGSQTPYLCAARTEQQYYESLFRGALRMVLDEQQRLVEQRRDQWVAGVARRDGQDRPAGGVAAESGRNGAPRRAHREESTQEEGTVAEGVTLAEQGEAAKEFLSGLLDRFGLEAMLEVRELDEQTVEIAADGEGLGMLVGPKGATLASIQDVTRTVVQRQFPHRTDRILVDVARYRERRAAALRRFAEDVAAEVRTSGAERALEPMSPPDRKVVHDTVVGLEGVSSSSRGEEPSRYVVISPEHAELAEPEGPPQD